jgi:hypothetical protein
LKLNIKSDGTVSGTHLYDEETGNEITLAQDFQIVMDMNSVSGSTLTLKFYDVRWKLHTKTFVEGEPAIMGGSGLPTPVPPPSVGDDPGQELCKQ